MSLPPPETLTTERLVLRPLREGDAEALHACYSDPEVVRFWDAAPHAETAETERFVARCMANPALRIWAITEPGGPDADLALGWILLRHIRAGVAEIGYVLRADRWGRGYMTEAARAVAAHGFEALALRRIGAETDPDNAASIAVLARLGFASEGRQRAARMVRGALRDSVLYGLLRPGLGGDGTR